jgi:hypothetical protein
MQPLIIDEPPTRRPRRSEIGDRGTRSPAEGKARQHFGLGREIGTGLQHQHPTIRIFRQPGKQRAARAAAADDHNIEMVPGSQYGRHCVHAAAGQLMIRASR